MSNISAGKKGRTVTINVLLIDPINKYPHPHLLPLLSWLLLDVRPRHNSRQEKPFAVKGRNHTNAYTYTHTNKHCS